MTPLILSNPITNTWESFVSIDMWRSQPVVTVLRKEMLLMFVSSNSPFCIVFSDSSIIYSDITKPPIFRWFQPVCSDFESGRCRPCDYQPIYICESNCSVFPHSKYFWRSAHRFWKINGNFLRAGIGRWKSIYSSYYVAILLLWIHFSIHSKYKLSARDICH